MRGKTLTNEVARLAVTERRQGRAYKVLDSSVGNVGEGEFWDESKAERAAVKLRALKSGLPEVGKILKGNIFDKDACRIVHETLALPPNLAASEGFWRWLAVEKFGDIIEFRNGDLSGSGPPAHLANYGIDTRAEYNRLAILWFRADMAYDGDSDDPYHLAARLSSTDFWESGVIRPRYGWCRNLARELVRFQYRDPYSSTVKNYLHLTNENGIRELYKRLRRLHSTVSFEYMSDEEIRDMLEEKSSDLRRS